MNHAFLQEALIYLAAAILFVPLVRRLGLGSVLGYLLAGIIIGPFALGLVGGEGKEVIHFAELGVVMMLFLIGLELEPSQFWRMHRLILGSGGVQLGLTTVLLLGAFLLIGLPWQAALAVGLALSMSSTAIVLQTFREKGLDHTPAGRCAFAVLLFQDLAVIPILAILPLLALHPLTAPVHRGTFLIGQPGWVQTLALLGAVTTVILCGRFFIVPFLRFIARLQLRELFTVSALFIVIGAAYIMEQVGLSPALGTFLAGIVLANSEYRHELESDIEPFKGVLLGLFFISVGAAINFALILEKPWVTLLLICGIIGAKGAVLMITGRVARLSLAQNLSFSLGMAQIGEFAFVLFSFMYQLQILSGRWTDTLMGVTALSMTATPLLLWVHEHFISPRIGAPETTDREADAIDLHHPVIIAGFGPFGSTLGRFLRANGVEATILDNDSDRVDLLRRMGFKAFYGDASRQEILKSAGADQAKLLVAAIGSPAINHEVVEKAKKSFPHMTFMVRAENHLDAFQFMEMGIDAIYRETLDTSVRLGVDILVRLGHRRYSAHRAGQNFIRYDEAAMEKLAPHRNDKSAYIFSVREQIQLQEELLANDRAANPSLNDHAWDNERGVDAPPHG